MSKVTLSLITVKADLPTGVTAGALRFIIHDAAGAVLQTQDVVSGDAVFDNVADGSYTATVVRLDSTGANLGAEVSAAFTAPAPALKYDAPSVLSVVVSAD